MVSSKELASVRRNVHRHPESGWQEFWTTALVAETFDELKFDLHFGPEIMDESDRLGVPDDDVIACARARAREWGAPDYLDQIGDVTGLVATRSFGDGPTVAFRCDLDALPLTESTDDSHRPAREEFASANPGVMHACGHDGHIAVAIGTARKLVADPGSFDGTLVFLFQPAEEGLRGGHPLSQSRHLDDVDYLFAYHIGLGVPSGEIVAGAEGFLASTKIDASYRGQSAHAGRSPQRGRNALHAASTASENLLGIARHGEGTTRVNVGRIEAGTARNTIPREASLELEVRGETTSINEYLEDRARCVIESSAAMHDVDVDLNVRGKAINESPSPELVDLCVKGFRDAGQFESVSPSYTVDVSEDATFLMRRVVETGGQATYVIVGADLADGHHTEAFDFDEAVLFPAVESFVHLVRETIQAAE